jgi:hypothetical protein
LEVVLSERIRVGGDKEKKRKETEREENSFTLHFGISVLFFYSLETKIKKAYSTQQGELSPRVR